MSTPDRARDEAFMDQALALARAGLGQTWPNPTVGCVLVREGTVVGEGATQPGGRPHAEAVALAAAGAAARGATAYVTLEPCANHGQTGPCADALTAAGVARVVAAVEDPDPRTRGQGFAILRAAGIAVETGVRAEAAAALNAGFFKRVQQGMPWLTLKLATSLDGRIAMPSGESRWITGPEARAEGHAMRACHDAVLIGAGTARADDPSLDVRDAPAPPRQPVRIVADPGLSMPLTGKLARTAGEQPLWILHAAHGIDPGRAAVFRDLGAVLFPAEMTPGGALDLDLALRSLGDEGLTRVLCEGGGRLAATLLAAGRVDELVMFTAGLAIGGDGTPGVAAMGQTRLADVPRLAPVEHRLVGADILTRWRPVPT